MKVFIKATKYKKKDVINIDEYKDNNVNKSDLSSI